MPTQSGWRVFPPKCGNELKVRYVGASSMLAWLLRQPGLVAPIVGVSKISHLDEVVAAVDVELGDEDCAYFEEIYQPKPIMSH